MQLDIMKDKWYFIPKSEAENQAFQEWLFSQGLAWPFTGAKVKPIPPDSCIGGNNQVNGRLGFALPEAWYANRGHTELKPTFKSVLKVDQVEMPYLESAQQKQIRELEETIARATQQIEELKKVV